MTATSATDFLVATGYVVWLLCVGLGAVFNNEKYTGTREALR